MSAPDWIDEDKRRLEVYEAALRYQLAAQAAINARTGGPSAREMTVEIPREDFVEMLKLSVEALENRVLKATEG